MKTWPSVPGMDPTTPDAVGQADLIRLGHATPLELVDAAIANIEAVNPRLNAVIRERFDAARADAVGPLPDGPFRGVPILFKDLGCEVEGESIYEGMQYLKDADYRAPHTDVLAQRFLDAGFIWLGRTNTPEIGLLPTSEPESYGPTHNPWRAGYTSGGSSGGSAAAVAGGMVAVAHANDGGGSIRIPASCCGLVGLKPSRGRVPISGTGNEISGFLIAEGVVSRTVRDTASILDVLSAPRVGTPTQPPRALRPFVSEVGAEPGALRIGVLADDPIRSGTLNAECVTAVEHTARLLEGLGHHVELSFPQEWTDPDAVLRFSSVWAADCAYAIDTWAEKVGRPMTAADMEPLTWSLAGMGRGVTGPQLLATIAEAMRAAQCAGSWWRLDPRSADSGFDLLLSPTIAEPPIAHGNFPSTAELPLTGFIRAGEFVPFTTQANVSGQPAISIPMHWTADGLPVGVQLMAAFGREDLLIQVAAQLEAAAPWADRIPPIHA